MLATLFTLYIIHNSERNNPNIFSYTSVNLFCVSKRIVALSEAVLVKYGNLRNMIKYILIRKTLISRA